jgi:hypothetical protein
MMNWIYNWYDPQGKLKVNELVGNVTRLFLSGLVAGSAGDQLEFKLQAPTAERLSVWREN